MHEQNHERITFLLNIELIT